MSEEDDFITTGHRVIVTGGITTSAHARMPQSAELVGQHGIVDSEDGWGLCHVLLDSGQWVTAWNGIDLEREETP